jgi:hypothetical protein
MPDSSFAAHRYLEFHYDAGRSDLEFVVGVMTGSIRRALICSLPGAKIVVASVFEHKERLGRMCDDLLPMFWISGIQLVKFPFPPLETQQKGNS